MMWLQLVARMASTDGHDIRTCIHSGSKPAAPSAACGPRLAPLTSVVVASYERNHRTAIEPARSTPPRGRRRQYLEALSSMSTLALIAKRIPPLRQPMPLIVRLREASTPPSKLGKNFIVLAIA